MNSEIYSADVRIWRERILYLLRSDGVQLCETRLCDSQSSAELRENFWSKSEFTKWGLTLRPRKDGGSHSQTQSEGPNVTLWVTVRNGLRLNHTAVVRCPKIFLKTPCFASSHLWTAKCVFKSLKTSENWPKFSSVFKRLKTHLGHDVVLHLRGHHDRHTHLTTTLPARLIIYGPRAQYKWDGLWS